MVGEVGRREDKGEIKERKKRERAREGDREEIWSENLPGGLGGRRRRCCKMPGLKVAVGFQSNRVRIRGKREKLMGNVYLR